MTDDPKGPSSLLALREELDETFVRRMRIDGEGDSGIRGLGHLQTLVGAIWQTSGMPVARLMVVLG